MKKGKYGGRKEGIVLFLSLLAKDFPQLISIFILPPSDNTFIHTYIHTYQSRQKHMTTRRYSTRNLDQYHDHEILHGFGTYILFRELL